MNENNKKPFLRYLLSIIPFFLPDIFNYKSPALVTVFRIFQIVILIYYFMIIIKNGKISKLIKYIFIYIIILFLITYFTDQDVYYCLKNSITVIGLCLVCEYGIHHDCETFFSCMIGYLGVLNIINFICILIYPNGMYLNNSGMYNNWFLGYKNSHILYILPWLMLIIFKNLSNHNNKIPFHVYFILIVSLLFIIHIDSGTSIIALVLLLFFLIFRNKLENVKMVSAQKLLIIDIIIFFSIVYLRIQDIFSFLFVNILGRTLTFTGRTLIWDHAILMIKKSLIFGYGDNAFFYNRFILSTHNQFLGIMYETGIIGFLIYLLLFRCITKEIDKSNASIQLSFSKYFIFIYLLMMLMEEYNMRYYMFVFVIIYNWCIINNKESKNI